MDWRIMDFDERFWSKVDASGPCWEWTAYTKPDGYGQVNRGGRVRSTHRYSYELLIGPIPDGLDLDHLCKNRRCVNPDHLEPVTRAENTRRGASPSSKARLKTHCPSGHEYTPENTYNKASGVRQCKACARAYDRARR